MSESEIKKTEPSVPNKSLRGSAAPLSPTPPVEPDLAPTTNAPGGVIKAEEKKEEKKPEMTLCSNCNGRGCSNCKMSGLTEKK